MNDSRSELLRFSKRPYQLAGELLLSPVEFEAEPVNRPARLPLRPLRQQTTARSAQTRAAQRLAAAAAGLGCLPLLRSRPTAWALAPMWARTGWRSCWRPRFGLQSGQSGAAGSTACSWGPQHSTTCSSSSLQKLAMVGMQLGRVASFQRGHCAMVGMQVGRLASFQHCHCAAHAPSETSGVCEMFATGSSTASMVWSHEPHTMLELSTVAGVVLALALTVTCSMALCRCITCLDW